MDYTYIVRNVRLKVGTEYRYPGDLIPEAADWKNLRAYVEAKQIERLAVDDEEVQAALKRQAPAEKPAAPKPEGKAVEKIAPATEAPDVLAGLDNLTAAMAQEAQRRLDQQARSAKRRE